MPISPDPLEVKRHVRNAYADLAKTSSSCCAPDCCEPANTTDLVSREYVDLPGYFPEADLGLGCGIPTNHADIRTGETVLDLGSGAGNDAFVARSLVGDEGRVLGVDMTEEMVDLARRNTARLGFSNVEFLLGDLENLPIPNDEIDVVVSNCVLNLVPDKATAFAEMLRVLRPGGRFCVSDIVTHGNLPASVSSAVALYAGCLAGAMPIENMLASLADIGFSGVRIVADRPLQFTAEQMGAVLSPDQIRDVQESGVGLSSVTLVGRKPGRNAMSEA